MSKQAEREYVRLLTGRSRVLSTAFLAALLPLLYLRHRQQGNEEPPEFEDLEFDEEPTEEEIQEAEGVGGGVLALLLLTYLLFLRQNPPERLRPALERLGQSIIQAQTAKTNAALAKAGIEPPQVNDVLSTFLEIDPRTLATRPQIEGWVNQNLTLIRSLETGQLEKLGGILLNGTIEGASVDSMAKKIAKEFGASERRALLIAKNETLTLAAQISEANQRAAGVTHYRWRTVGDERVRGEELVGVTTTNHIRNNHRVLNNTIRAWNDPHPSEGHPGHAVLCRCTAIPLPPTVR